MGLPNRLLSSIRHVQIKNGSNLAFSRMITYTYQLNIKTLKSPEAHYSQVLARPTLPYRCP